MAWLVDGSLKRMPACDRWVSAAGVRSNRATQPPRDFLGRQAVALLVVVRGAAAKGVGHAGERGLEVETRDVSLGEKRSQAALRQVQIEIVRGDPVFAGDLVQKYGIDLKLIGAEHHYDGHAAASASSNDMIHVPECSLPILVHDLDLARATNLQSLVFEVQMVLP